MPVMLYMDVHIAVAIPQQLRLRGVNVLRAQEDDGDEKPDDELLVRTTGLNRVVFTHDHRFRAMAEQWMREGRIFGGLAFGPMNASLIGRYVSDLHLIATATDSDYWKSRVEYLPF